MKEFLTSHQLNIMLSLGSICGMTAIFTLISNSLSQKRKTAMLWMEISAMILLYADRFAYIYRGNVSLLGFVMTRVSNFLVYATTITVVFGVNLYVIDLCLNEGGSDKVPDELSFNNISLFVGEILIVISQFTGFYYTFDASNHYVRSQGFIVCYMIPVLTGLLQLLVIIRYYRKLSKRLALPLMTFTLAPIVAGCLQLIFYGLSLVNITMVGIILIIYVFNIIDTNEALERAHKTEMETLLKEKMSMKRLFKQTSTAFVASIEMKDPFLHGRSERVADIARRLAELSGKDDEECDRVYYTALLHDIGMIGLPDSLIGKNDNLTEEEYKQVKKKPVLSSEILAGITEYPYLSKGARYCFERYDGKGYPDGLSGNNIPEISRIISVANAYDSMTTKQRFRDALPLQIVREELIKGAGAQFDPDIADLMVHLMDMESKDYLNDISIVEKEISCKEYREHVSIGYPVMNTVDKLRFRCKTVSEPGKFSAPSIILFDAYDRMVHDNQKAIDANRYLEYGELWFDGNYISTGARNMEIRSLGDSPDIWDGVDQDNASQIESNLGPDNGDQQYEITMGRYEDHIRMVLSGAGHKIEAIVALPNKSKQAYIGLTGENCTIYDIEPVQGDEIVSEGSIPRIAEEISYIDRIESDVPNVQVDRVRSASTVGIEIKDGTHLSFHSMSLPTANLVWNCPYVVLFYSDDKKVHGKGYHEYALIKLNGENENPDTYSDNRFIMRKDADFSGWDNWKTLNKEGYEYEVAFIKKGSKVTILADNLGIHIENVCRLNDGARTVYAALTGDQVALTDIRIL